MNPSLEETIYIDFITSSPTTGAATDADSTPTCEVFEDATDTAILTPTVVKRSGKTGDYRVPVACTAGNGFEAAKSYNVVVSATVGAVAAKAVIRTFQMRTNDADDLAASILTRAAPGAAMTLTSAYDAAKTASSQSTQDTLASYVDTEVAAIKSKTDNLPASPAAVGSAMTLTSAYDAAKTAASQASVNTIDDFVDTEVAAIKAVTDKLDTALVIDGAVYQYTANALELAPVGGGGGGGDAQQATLLAVKAKTDALPSDPADASDIAASFTVVNGKLDAIDDFVDTEVSAIKSKTDQLNFNGSGDVKATLDGEQVTLTLSALSDIADAILKRDFNSISGEAAYSLLNAARMLRNSWDTAGGVLKVRKEDGTTIAWQRTLAVDPAAQPIVGAS